ncbi:pep-cterm sorting domain-containing protein [Anaeramoeba flamelloides]|uniref:Pep-cterm sorting domain-containing protein n=1 Tax=Anaeramoeba flamelloides TaxID=1746091 RepID=A0AAV7ZBD2_9EUKA|nr:pep-cterm sorting domain-containing protein [Anaeramoeba flamelloides]
MEKNYSVPIHSNYEQYINNPELSDVTFFLGENEEKFYAHHFFLSLSSNFFRKYFYPLGPTGKPLIGEFYIKDVDTTIFKQTIKFCYTGFITLSYYNVSGISKLAYQLKMKKLIEICSNFFIENHLSSNIPINFVSKPSGSNLSTGSQTLHNNNKNEVNFESSNNNNNNLNTNNKTNDSQNEVTIKNEKEAIPNIFQNNEANTRTLEKEENIKEKTTTREIEKEKDQRELPKIIELKAIQGNEKSNPISNFKVSNGTTVSPKAIISLKNTESNQEKESLHDILLKNQMEMEKQKENEKGKGKGKENESKSEKEKETKNLTLKYPKLKIRNIISQSRSIVRRPLNTKPNVKAKVAMIAADEDFKYVKNVCDSILKSYKIKKVKIFKSFKKSYPFKELKKYDVAFVYSSDHNFYKPYKLGNMLAQYVEDGGGLVLCSINCLDSDDEHQLYGRIISPQFLPFGKHSSISEQPCSIGQMVDSKHPILKKVKNFHGGEYSFRIKTKQVYRNSFVIARWEDGNILIAEKTFPKNSSYGRVIALNMWPPNNKIDESCWNIKSDGQRLLTNAVEYAAGCTGKL